MVPRGTIVFTYFKINTQKTVETQHLASPITNTIVSYLLRRRKILRLYDYPTVPRGTKNKKIKY